MTMEQGASSDRAEVLAHLLSKDEKQSRDEPLIAANIGEQLSHMGLDGWSISVIRRVRDAIGRIQPARLLEVGASIGHRSAWFYDAAERFETPMTAYTLVEPGNKFAVILHRLRTRYGAESWSSIVVGDPKQLAAEHRAWTVAAATGMEIAETPFETAYEAIVVDGPQQSRASTVRQYLPLLSSGGVLLTTEPSHPTGEVDEEDAEAMKVVHAFNDWIELVKETQPTHHLAFMPVFGGTVVAWMPRLTSGPTAQ